MSFQRAPLNDTQLEIPLTFSLHFSQTPAGDSSLRLVETSFSTKSLQLVKMDFLASGIRFLLFRGFSF